MPQLNPPRPYRERDCILEAAADGARGAAFGLIAGTFTSALSRRPLMRTIGSATAFFAGAFGVFRFVEAYSCNLRKKDDFLNSVAGGAAIGLIAGSLRRRPLANVGGLALMSGFALGFAAWLVRDNQIIASDSEAMMLAQQFDKENFGLHDKFSQSELYEKTHRRTAKAMSQSSDPNSPYY